MSEIMRQSGYSQMYIKCTVFLDNKIKIYKGRQENILVYLNYFNADNEILSTNSM